MLLVAPLLLAGVAVLLAPLLALIVSLRRTGSGVEGKAAPLGGTSVAVAASCGAAVVAAEVEEEEEEEPPILQLQARLAEAFAAAKAAGQRIGLQQDKASAARLDARVRGLVREYLAAGHTDWQDYVHWNDHHYVRNLVWACEDFELIVLCWRYGQGSRVHNHADSHCWLTVLAGCVHELQYRMPGAAGTADGAAKPPAPSAPVEPPALPGVLGASAPCPKLRHIGTSELQAGETGYINDSIALHAVRVPEHCEGQGAVTMHIYAPPIRRVKLYEPDNNRVVQRQPGYFTVGLGRTRKQLLQLLQKQQCSGGGSAGTKPGPAAAAAAPSKEMLAFSYEI